MSRLRTFALVFVLLVAVATLTAFTLRTTLQLDRLRQQSVIEAIAAVATEKANHIDRKIVEQDNAVIALLDPAELLQIEEDWLPIAKRETPTLRALFVLDEAGNVLATGSRTGGSEGDAEFRRLLVGSLFHELSFDPKTETKLRHLHKTIEGQSTLVSYWVRRWESRRYIMVAWYDVARIIRELLGPVILESTSSVGRVNVLDEEGRSIAGPPLQAGAFSVSVQFPTTLYNWRVQVTPTNAEAIAERAEGRRKLEMLTVGLSGLVVLLGAAILLIATEKQRRLAALKSDFVANVSHELRTPLALVRMFAELLHSGRAQSEDKRLEYAGIVMRESERLSALIDNVLDFAKLERGKATLYKEELDLRSLARKVIAQAQSRAERESIKVTLECHKTTLPVHADAHAVELALSNLLDNAFKYGGSGKEVVVRVFREGKLVHVSVADQGPGVPAEMRARIFERFERGAQAKDKSGDTVRGSGIGLSLVKHVAESHGGKAWVQPGGTGATFVFALPVSPKAMRRARI